MSVFIISIVLIGALFNGVFGDCSLSPTSECDVIVDPEFLCRFGFGMFPDPIDCRVYHYCGTDTSYAGITYECPNGFIYNSRLHMCEIAPANTTDICAGRRLECGSWEYVSQMVRYPFHSAYKGYCYVIGYNSTTVVVSPYILKCPYEDVQEFIWGMQHACQFICFQQGYFPNPGNCEEYYYCAGENASAVMLACPPNYVFDGSKCTGDKTKCVPRSYF